MGRRNFSPTFKAKIAIAALRTDKTITELASEHQIHPVLVAKWKKQFLEQASSIFEDGRKKKPPKDIESEKNALYEEIGRLKVQLDWIKKKSGLV